MRSWVNQIQSTSEENEDYTGNQQQDSINPNDQKKTQVSKKINQSEIQGKKNQPTTKNQSNNPNFQIRIEEQPKIFGLNLDEKEKNLEKLMREFNFPSEFPNYSSKDYWNTRYTHEQGQNYEWLQPYSYLKPQIARILQGKMQTATSLYIGCGNSQLGEEMALDGYTNISCLDYSNVLIEDLKQRFHQYSNSKLSYECMDVCNKLEFNNNSVDLIIDKGLMDAILCGEGFYERLSKMLSECYRVLKPRGTLLVLSQGHPDTRVLYLKTTNQPFQLNIQEIKKVQIPQFAALDDLQCHYLYICQKV